MTARDSLVDATKKLLSTQGYESTSPAQIQKASGVGQGSFYHHFDGKADLASAALASLAEEMSAQFDALTDRTGMAVIDAFLSVDRDALAGCRIGRISMETSINDDRIQAPIATYFDHVHSRLVEGLIEAGPPTGTDAESLADLIVATVQGGFVVARATGRPEAQSRAISALVALLSA